MGCSQPIPGYNRDAKSGSFLGDTGNFGLRTPHQTEVELQFFNFLIFSLFFTDVRAALSSPSRVSQSPLTHCTFFLTGFSPSKFLVLLVSVFQRKKTNIPYLK